MARVQEGCGGNNSMSIHNHNHKYKKSGFTLVELSIVIVIIGLLVGGVTAGMSLVRQAGLRGVISDVNKYKAAVNTFKLQYNALPGDITNATSYWPSAGTANGNGNRFINSAGANNDTESMYAWQHLSLSGLIPGAYTGSGNVTVGVNLPTSSIDSRTGYVFIYLDPAFGVYTNSVSTGWVISVNTPWGGSLSPAEAYNIDTKMDDGIPSLGKVFGYQGNDTGVNCASANYNAPYTPSAVYYQDITTKSCRMSFLF